jgi:ribosomal protein S27E
MTAMAVSCPSCQITYNVVVNPSLTFYCSKCGVKVAFDLEGKSEIFKELADNSIQLEQPSNDRYVDDSSDEDSKVVPALITWLIVSVIIFSLCAFSQYTIEVDEWSSISRGILGTGVVGSGIVILYLVTKDD